MKNLILILSALFSIQSAMAQITSGAFRQLNVPLNLKECQYDGTYKTDVHGIDANAKFTVVNVVKNAAGDNEYVINFWSWISDSKYEAIKNDKSQLTNVEKDNFNKYTTLNYDVSGRTKTHIYFKLSQYQIDNITTELTSRLQPTAGTLIIPIKFRFKPGDFSKDLTFSGTGGIRYSLKKRTDISFSLIAGVGISSVTLDSLSTEGEVSESSDFAAATALGGVLMEWKFLQMGVFVGADWLARKNENDWEYQGKPWLGVGIGLALFSKENTVSKEGKTQ